LSKVAIITPSSPAFADIDRQAAGGMGLWKPRDRGTVGHSEFAQYDLTLLSVAGVLLDRGYEVAFIDGQGLRLDTDALADRVRSFQPDTIVGMVQFVSLGSDLDILSVVKERSACSCLVAVGSVNRILKENVAGHAAVDFVIEGEPELATADLLDALAEGGGDPDIPGVGWFRDGEMLGAAPGGRVALAELPPLPYHLLAPYPYIDEFYFKPDKLGLVISSRGCPYQCRYYCPYPLAYGRKVVFRSPEVVVDEVEYLHREFGVRSFHFRDQVFTLSEDHAREVCHRLRDRELDIRWLCETRVDLIHSDAMLADMMAAGCVQIDFGLESGDPELFAAVGKPGIDLARAEETVVRVRGKGLGAHVHVIVGLPGETWETLRNTANFLQRLGLSHINPNRCIPYPGTDLREEALAQGRVQTDDWTQYGNAFVMRTEDLSTRQLELAFQYLVRNIYGGVLGRRGRITTAFLNMLVEKVIWRGRGSVRHPCDA